MEDETLNVTYAQRKQMQGTVAETKKIWLHMQKTPSPGPIFCDHTRSGRSGHCSRFSMKIMNIAATQNSRNDPRPMQLKELSIFLFEKNVI
jgi:hypothetical protein